MTYQEYLQACEPPDVHDLDRRQVELLKQIEFVAMMREAWGDDIQEA
jgi:hypothetical protein